MGANSLWTNPTNWDRLAVPDANSDVVITNTGGKHVVLNVDTTVASISVLGGAHSNVLDLVGVNIHADGASLIDSNATIEVISNSTFSGAGSLQNSGVIYVPANSGTVSFALNCNFSNSGAIDVETNSTLSLATSDPVIYTFITGTTFSGPGTVQFATGNEALNFNGVMMVNGTIEMEAGISGNSSWTGPGLFRWLAGGIGGVTFAPDFHVEVSGVSGGQGIFNNCTNQGSVRLLGPNRISLYNGGFFNSGLFQIGSNCDFNGAGGSGFVNSGTIKVPAELGTQTLEFGCDCVNSGTIDVETNSSLELPNSNYAQTTFLDGTILDGPGTIRFLGNNQGLLCTGVMTVNGVMEYDRQPGMFGSAFWTGPGLLRFQAGGIGGGVFSPGFHTEVSGTFVVYGDSTNQGTMHLVGTNEWSMMQGTFYNTGTFQIDSNCDFESQGSPGSFANLGTILLPANLGPQTVSLGCNFANAGTIDVETNSTLLITGLNNNVGFSLGDGTVFDGPGTVRFSNTSGSVLCNGIMTVNGNLEIQQAQTGIYGSSTWTGPGLLRWEAGGLGGFTFAPDFHVEMSGPAVMFQDCTNQGSIRAFGSNYLYISNGTFHNDGLFQIESNGYLQSYSGNFENSGTIRMPGSLGTQLWTVDHCGFTNYGTIDVEAGSTLALFATNTQPSDTVFSFLDGSGFAGSGTLQLLPQMAGVSCFGTMNVSNTVEFNSQSLMYGSSKWTGPGLLRWLNGGISGFTFAPDFHAEISGPGWKYLSLDCTNQGTLRWLGGGHLAGGGAGPEVLHNEGLLEVDTDGFWWDFPLINETGGTFHQLGGILTVDSFTNSGTAIFESGNLNAQYTFSSGASGVYQVSLGGTTPVTNFHQLGAANCTLDGALVVTLTNGFVPADGSTFVIAANTAQTGTFSSVTLPSLPLPLSWEVQYMTNSVVLAVKAVPAAITNASFASGQFQFSFNGPAASAYDVQVSTNLTDWTTVETNSPFSGSVLFTDTNSPNMDHRYYRCRIFQ